MEGAQQIEDCACHRWSVKIWHDFLEDRPWERVIDFYSCLISGKAFFHDLRIQTSEKEFGTTGTDLQSELDYSLQDCLSRRGGKWERKTIKLVIAYLGTAFVGWQKQSGFLTVQSVIESALGKFVDGRKAAMLKAEGKPIEAAVSVAGRTDKGVHAVGQVCSFYTWMQDVDVKEIEAVINAIAPFTLRIVNVMEVPRSFHPNFSAKWRRYIYILPLKKSEAYGILDAGERSAVGSQVRCREHIDKPNQVYGNGMPIPEALDVSRVDKLLRKLEGKCLSYAVFARDTKIARSSGEPTECTMYHARAAVSVLPLYEEGGLDTKEETKIILIELVANRFLRKMVRVLVATALREAAAGAAEDGLLRIMEHKDRRASAPPAPSMGLCLAEVGYQDVANAKFIIN